MNIKDNIWGVQSLNIGQARLIEFGYLSLRICRETGEWRAAWAYETEPHLHPSIGDAQGITLFEEPENLRRWVSPTGKEQIRLTPALPELDLLVRPEHPLDLLPQASLIVFIGIPLTLVVDQGEDSTAVLKLCSQEMSRSWFGEPSDGSLCFTLKTRARLHYNNEEPDRDRALCQLKIVNTSDETLTLNNLRIQPKFLALYREDTGHVWTDGILVRFRGADRPPQFETLHGPREDLGPNKIPEWFPAKEKVKSNRFFKMFG